MELDPRHALYVGWVAGLALRNGVRLLPVVDDAGNYTDRLTLNLIRDVPLTIVVPYPPADWTLPDD